MTIEQLKKWAESKAKYHYNEASYAGDERSYQFHFGQFNAYATICGMLQGVK